MSTLYKRNCIWTISFYCAPGCPQHPTGHTQHCVSLRTKNKETATALQKDFDKALALQKARVALGLSVTLPTPDLGTLTALRDRYEKKVLGEQLVRPATWDRSERWALNRLITFAPTAQVADLTQDWMQQYEAATRSALSPYSWNSQRATLRAIGNRWVAWGWVPHNPFVWLTRAKVRKKRPKRLLQEQLPVILAAIPNRFWRLVTLFFYATGVRRQELCDLQRTAVRRAQGYIEIETNKENNPKVIALTPEINWIVTEAERLCPDSQYVFSRHGPPLHPEAVKNYYRWLSKKVGFAVSTHRFRHAHGTHRMEAGDNLKTVSDTLGHADIRTTADFYLDLDLPAQRAALSRLPIAKLVRLSRRAPVQKRSKKRARKRSRSLAPSDK